jgi:hypothetical protein
MQYKVVIDITFQDERPDKMVELDNNIEQWWLLVDEVIGLVKSVGSYRILYTNICQK